MKYTYLLALKCLRGENFLATWSHIKDVHFQIKTDSADLCDNICCCLQNVPVTYWRNLCLVKQHFQIGTVQIQLHKILKINQISSVQHIIVLFQQKVHLVLPAIQFYSHPLCAPFFRYRNKWSFCVWSWYPSEK